MSSPQGSFTGAPMQNHFDRGKPFYPQVISYISQLVGFKELALQGFAGPRSLNEVVSAFVALGGFSARSPEELTKLRSQIQTLMGPLELRSEFQGDRITVEVNSIAGELAFNAPYLMDSIVAAAGSVFIVAHEISKGKPWHDLGPLWEFLRHCRNAVAHGGRFNLRNGEPRRLAKWGRFEIAHTLHGVYLFKRPDGSGMPAPGDPIRLLWDIEQTHPQMAV